MTRPQLVMLAGPNGAGKSTFYESHLASSPLPFLNADMVAARTGIESLEAARLLDALRERMVTERRSFITETVFSDPVGSKLGLLRRAIDAGYDVVVIYVGIERSLATFRIDQRVAQGGHDVPRDRLASRFKRSLANLRSALPLAMTVKIYDNSSLEEPHRLLAIFQDGHRRFVSGGSLPSWARTIVARKRWG